MAKGLPRRLSLEVGAWASDIRAHVFAMNNKKIAGVVAIALQAFLAWGLVRTTDEALEVYHEMPVANAQDEAAFKEALANSLRHLERSLPFALGGVAIAIIAYLAMGMRDRWFFWGWLLMSLLWLVVIPFGTVIGLVSIGFLIARRKEFLSPALPR